MTFRFSRQGLTDREAALERLFEILPGATSWAILLGMLGLSFWKPILAAVLVIAFDLYWLLRLFYMTLFLILSSLRLSLEQGTDWMARVRGLDHLGAYLQELRHNAGRASLRQRLSRWVHRRQLEAFVRSGLTLPASEALCHLVIFTVANESCEILQAGLESLLRQRFPPERILVVLAVEERVDRTVRAGLRDVQSQYRQRFLDFLVVIHPDGLPGEARVKGANATYAAKAAGAYFNTKGISCENVIVSCFDADTVVSPDYFSCLTYAFMTCPERTRASFQPIPVYHNNIWDVPGFARVLDIGSSFFQLIEATNPEKLVTFSSHSMSFKALVEVGYWPVDMISDDSAICWKAFIHFDGRYRVVPLYVTLSMDVAAAGSWWQAAANVYRQKRRWAWGVENFPLVMRAFLNADRIPFSVKLRHGFKLFENHVSWATSAFLLSVIGWFPALFAGREFSNSVLYYSAPRMTAAIFHLASLALLATIVLSLCLLPRSRTSHPILKRIGHAVEWLLIPFFATFFSALPALDAQTRLMLGRYMEFWVAGKRRNTLGKRWSLSVEKKPRMMSMKV